MKQTFLSLLKGLILSLFLFLALFFLFSFFLYQMQWNNTIMSILLYVGFALSCFLGSFYFSGKAPARRFLWGLGFGICFFGIYLLLCFLLPTGSWETQRITTFLAVSLLSGMCGGMLS